MAASQLPVNGRPEMSCLEIERKFLIAGDRLPVDLSALPVQELIQGYIVVSPEKTVRIRRTLHQCYLTVKSGHGVVRSEYEGTIPVETFEALWPATEGRRIEKRRYEMNSENGLRYELDVFAGALKGLVLVEVEFSDVATARTFVPPDWFGPELTDNPAYTNSALSINGLPRL